MPSRASRGSLTCKRSQRGRRRKPRGARRAERIDRLADAAVIKDVDVNLLAMDTVVLAQRWP